jgi:hypothetical protein
MSGSFREHLTGLSRTAAVGWFLQTWYGIPELLPVAATPQIPSLLGQLLSLCRSYPTICGQQNRLIPPVDIGAGLVCFYVENQNVYRWAYRSGEADPVVLGQRLGTDAWVAEQERLIGFLLQVCLFEALFSAPYTASAAWLPDKVLTEVLDRGQFQPILTPWRWPEDPTVFCASDGAIGVTSQQHRADGTSGFDVMVAAQDLAPLAYLPEIIREYGDRWEHARLASFVW